MKRVLLLFFILLYAWVIRLHAQTIPSTAGHSLSTSPPTGWTTQLGEGPVTANRSYHGSLAAPYTNLMPTIPGTPVLPPIPSGANTFLAIHGGIAKATISGLQVGQTYKFAYSIIATQLASTPENFTEFAVFRLKQGAGTGGTIAKHIHDIDKVTQNSIWRSGVFEFTSLYTTATLYLEAGNSTVDGGIIGLDLGPNAVTPCFAGITAVPLQKTPYEIVCPESSVNLVTFFGGLKPSGVDLVFFNNPTHTGLPLANINVGAGTYYAFYYDPVNNCYNQDVSTAKIEITYRNCADISPTMTINGLNFPEGSSRDFVVNLYEVNNGPTSGNVSFRITKIGGFNITYPTDNTLSNVAGGTMNQNKNWTFTETTNFITATSSVPIPANGQAIIGFKIQRKQGIPKGVTQNITPTILTGSGGDANVKNNNSVTSVSTN